MASMSSSSTPSSIAMAAPPVVDVQRLRAARDKDLGRRGIAQHVLVKLSVHLLAKSVTDDKGKQTLLDAREREDETDRVYAPSPLTPGLDLASRPRPIRSAATSAMQAGAFCPAPGVSCPAPRGVLPRRAGGSAETRNARRVTGPTGRAGGQVSRLPLR